MLQTIVLFHSALGLRPAVRSFADRLRAAGHRVHTPDLFMTRSNEPGRGLPPADIVG